MREPVSLLSPRNQMLVQVVRVWFEPRCGRPHFAPMHNDMHVSVAGTAQNPEF